MSETAFVILIGVGMVVAGLVWVRLSLGASIRRETRDAILYLEQQSGTTSLHAAQQAESLRSSWQQVSGQVLASLDQGREAVDNRLGTTNRVIGDMNLRLGELGASARQLEEMGKNIQELQRILGSPKLRGNLGEWFLGDLLAQWFPPDQYQLQYAFKGGETVDAVLRLQQGLVAIDAKFPLENLRRFQGAAEETAMRQARKEFDRDVRKHVDAIAAKYIRPDEGTFPFALMYLPAEGVYYETIVRGVDGQGGTIHDYALQRRVIPVSPGSLFGYLQTVLLGLRGLRIEEHARTLLNGLDRLQGEVEQFGETFRVVGSHLDNARKKIDEAERAFAKVEARLDQIHGLLETGRE
ncbi:MAG TPA: DNA recombination protein RmuC [Kiritimatiellia bacterium]|nr:DNA recombination protein RmuC [Kiritimatiellia bacterium]